MANRLHARSDAAVFASPCGWELPLSYGDPEAEYRAVRTGVGRLDRSGSQVVEVTGQDRVSFLQGMLSNDIQRLASGHGCPAAFLDAHGKVQALLTVLMLEERVLLLLESGQAAKTLQALEKYRISEKASFKDVSAETTLLMVAGPRTGEVIEGLTGAPLPGAPWAHAERRVGQVAVRVVAGGGETGEAEAWLFAPAASAELIRTNTADAGRPVGLRLVGFTALDVLRVEAGTPWYGHDVDETVLLPEIPSEPYVSYTKGCYIGQEVVARIKYRGHVNRALTGLTFDGNRPPTPGAPVEVDDGREAGRVTSPVHSLALNRPVALAFIRREHLEPGTLLAVKEENGGTLPARVTALPFYRRGAA